MGCFFSLIRVASQLGFERAAGRTADPSTSLRFGRDDKGRGVVQVGSCEWEGEKQWRDLLFSAAEIVSFRLGTGPNLDSRPSHYRSFANPEKAIIQK
jgi:hypothetical protein